MLKYSLRFDAIGTQWQIETNHKLPTKLYHKLLKRTEQYDQTYSRFRSDSLVSCVAKKEGIYNFPSDALHIIEFYHQLYTLTDGKFTPLIGSMLERAGYDATYSFIEKTQVQLPTWDDCLDWQGTTLQTTQPVTLDIGAAGKGYLVDVLADLLNKAGISEYVIDASGDILHKGLSKNIIGLEHPLQADHIIGTVDVQNKSLCASAINRRAWGNDMHHIFDPAKQAPVRDIVATWVIAKDAIVADGLATALFFTDPNLLAEHYNYQYVRLHKDMSVEYSKNFQGKVFV